MNRRNLIIAAGVIILAALIFKKPLSKILPTGGLDFGSTPGSSDNATTPAPIPGRPQVEILTTKGLITLELRPDVAPKTVANFLAKWNGGYCDNKTFHRVEDWVVQGCDPKGDGTGGSTNLPTETSGESFTSGAVGVARKSVPKDLSNDSQFFIVKKDSTFLDNEYTYFGKVVSGLDVVDKLSVGDKIISTTLLSK